MGEEEDHGPVPVPASAWRAVGDGADIGMQRWPAAAAAVVKVLAHEIEGADAKALRETLDKLKDKLGSAVIVLASANDNKVSLVAGVTKDQTAKIKAGELVIMVAQQVGGKGGGRPEMAQAGGDNPAGLAEALKSVPIWVREQL